MRDGCAGELLRHEVDLGMDGDWQEPTKGGRHTIDFFRREYEVCGTESVSVVGPLARVGLPTLATMHMCAWSGDERFSLDHMTAPFGVWQYSTLQGTSTIRIDAHPSQLTCSHAYTEARLTMVAKPAQLPPPCCAISSMIPVVKHFSGLCESVCRSRRRCCRRS